MRHEIIPGRYGRMRHLFSARTDGALVPEDVAKIERAIPILVRDPNVAEIQSNGLRIFLIVQLRPGVEALPLEAAQILGFA